MQKNTKIIVCYHRDSDIFESDALTPLHVGKANNLETLKTMQGDNSGTNISAKNPTYCELTGLYWLWKNIDADNYGLFHYRRFLDIKNRYDINTFPSEINISDFSNKNINKLMNKFDILVPTKNKLKDSVYEEYKKHHIAKDLDLVVNLIEKYYPEYKIAINKVLKSNKMYYCNMFVMKKDLFNEYCNWLFDILGKTEQAIDLSKYDSYQKRIFGFLSERMLNIFIEYKLSTNPKLKIKELRRINILPEPIKKVNFIIGRYARLTDKIYFNILNLKFCKKLK